MIAAAITFLIGALFLLAWLNVTTADKTALRLLRKAVRYFVIVPLLMEIALALPAGMIAGASGSHFGPGPFVRMVVLFPLIEEFLKSWASRSANGGVQAFALVSLFGVFELMLSKPFALAVGEPPDVIPLLWDVALAIPALFLHLLTAAIYAFWLREKFPAAFVVCAVLHALFNSVAMGWLFPALPAGAFLLLIVPLLVATIALFPRKGSARRGEWCDPATSSESQAVR